MRTVDFRFEARAEIELTGRELHIIEQASARHYDALCKMVAHEEIRDPNTSEEAFVFYWIRYWIQARVVEEYREKVPPKKSFSSIKQSDLFESDLFKQHDKKIVLIRNVTARQADLVCKILEFLGYPEVTQEQRDLQIAFRKLFGAIVREYEEANK